ncbi:DUF2637 domain-containing protein [Streptomyces albipurpureus]|uniref:DUF2637 domain-containing protein n=1 Tax=Streptomyces albipurpureus TaxID=2897419 RepID=A0ABT0UUC1_9ACTN|nr:DUF2637 domain-containing protein [Streptomyces sp. CWNU-1]MCM2392039.1 DUF2637 domain-containing protein [Streptomyces sp. CWNU-1]
MTPSTTASHDVAPVGPWDRLAILALGAAGCALSYDALQQMAVAIHVRGFLTYLFPLVIDGFIAYGVRALLVLRTAPFGARLYVWALFGTATTASIWANALHAVRLNQQIAAGGGLRLGDTVVAILSTLAPLALAGAVHLYILITRHHPHTTSTATGTERDRGPQTGTVPTHRPGDRELQPVPTPRSGTDPRDRTDTPPDGDRPAGTGTGPESGTVPSGPRDRTLTPGTPGTGDRDRAGRPSHGTGPEHHPAGDRPTVPDGPGDQDRTVPDIKPLAEGPTKPKKLGTGDRDRRSVTPSGPAPSDVERPRDRADRTAATDGKDVRPRAVPGTVTKAQRKGTGGRSRTGRGPRSRFSEDDIVALIHPHVPTVLERDGNEAITRVQLREIMRDQRISIRNENLSPVLQRLRDTTGTTTTRSTR